MVVSKNHAHYWNKYCLNLIDHSKEFWSNGFSNCKNFRPYVLKGYLLYNVPNSGPYTYFTSKIPLNVSHLNPHIQWKNLRWSEWIFSIRSWLKRQVLLSEISAPVMRAKRTYPTFKHNNTSRIMNVIHMES